MIPVYVNDIKNSLKNKSFFSALALTLTLPDICGMAEFPNKSVGERYIEWYDKYLHPVTGYKKNDPDGAGPWLSGEIVYNLRNTYLHQGSPDINKNKVKDPQNQIDRFILLLGDGTQIYDAAINIDARDGKLSYKAILVDVTYLCHTLCDCALQYYEDNKNKFSFSVDVISQEELENPSKKAQGDVIAKLLNQKLESQGSSLRIIERE